MTAYLGNFGSKLGTIRKNNSRLPGDAYTVIRPSGANPISVPLNTSTGESTIPANIRDWSLCGAFNYDSLSTPLSVTNTYDSTPLDALAAVEVTGQGDGLYVDGDILAVSGGVQKLAAGATFQIRVIDGVIQPNPKVIRPGIYAGIGSYALTAQHTAVPASGLGSGATFNFTRKDAMYEFGQCTGGWNFCCAVRQWHGAYDFLSPANCLECTDEGYTPDDTKYLKVTWQTYNAELVYQNFEISALPVSFTGTVPTPTMVDPRTTTTGGLDNVAFGYADGFNRVDENSGVVDYQVLCQLYRQASTVASTPTWGDKFGSIKNGISWDFNTDEAILDGGNTISAGDPAYVGFPKCGVDPITNDFADPNDGESKEWEFRYYDPDTSDYIYISDTGEPPKYTAAGWISDYPTADRNVIGPSTPARLTYTWRKIVRTNTGYDFIEVLYVSEGCYSDGTSFGYPGSGWNSISCFYKSGTVTLSEPNTTTRTDPASSGHPDVVWDGDKILLNQWKLTDQKLMPFNTTAFTGEGQVKVSRSEVPQDVSPETYYRYYKTGVPLVDGEPQIYTDPNATKYDGSILGAPNTAGGDYPVDYYMADFVEWDYGCCKDGTFNSAAYGASVTCDPGGSPQWDYLAYGCWRSTYAHLPPRATQWTNALEGELFSVGRQRCVKLAIPGGAPAVDLAKATVNGLWFSKWSESRSGFPAYNYARPFGLDRNAKDTAHQICEDAITTACDPAYHDGDCTRWDNVPPMAGRLAITSIVDNGDGTVTVTHEAMPVLNAADAHNPLYNVNLCGSDMTPLATNLTPTDVSFTEFTVTATYADVAAAKWLVLYGALTGESVTGVAGWEWNTDNPKGDYWIGEWNFNNGVYSDAIGTQHAGLGCCLYQICLSPNADDTPTSGARYDFATAWTPDEKCGSAQWLDVIGASVNWLWQTPVPCADAPTCTPLVEARLTPPTGAPSGGNFANTTVDLTAATGIGDEPPKSASRVLTRASSQPGVYYAPSGNFTPCE